MVIENLCSLASLRWRESIALHYYIVTLLSITHYSYTLTGLRPSLLSIAPFLGLQQCSYDILKLYAVKHYSESSSTFLICGAFAGMGAQTVSVFLKLFITVVSTIGDKNK